MKTRKEKELQELVRLYDSSETYDEFQVNRDINGLHKSNWILGVLDIFKLIQFLERHPGFSAVDVACWASGAACGIWMIAAFCCAANPVSFIISVIFSVLIIALTGSAAYLLVQAPVDKIYRMSRKLQQRHNG